MLALFSAIMDLIGQHIDLCLGVVDLTVELVLLCQILVLFIFGCVDLRLDLLLLLFQFLVLVVQVVDLCLVIRADGGVGIAHLPQFLRPAANPACDQTGCQQQCSQLPVGKFHGDRLFSCPGGASVILSDICEQRSCCPGCRWSHLQTGSSPSAALPSCQRAPGSR